MSEEKLGRIEEIAMQVYGYEISEFARGVESLHKHAVSVCVPAIVGLTLPEHYASILLTSRMDNELRKLLKRALHRQGDADELLFKFECSFGSFSAKISAAYSFGFMTKKMYDALTCCRKIRNAYAHTDSPDDAVDSKDYKKYRPKLLNLDEKYVADCIAKLRALREGCKGVVESLPDFSEIVAVMVQICDNLGSTAFFAGANESRKLRFPCACFGLDDTPAHEMFA
jgi:hypothetical protein